MFRSEFKAAIFISCVLVISFLSVEPAISSPVSQWIELNRENYICKIDTAKFTDFKGKRILLSTIEDRSKNTSNLSYYSPDRTIGYALYYSSHSMRQPVVSYYWYALKKAFECTDVTIEENGPAYDAELSLKFDSLTDEEIIFSAELIKNSKISYTRSHVVKMPKIDIAKMPPPEVAILNALGKQPDPLDADIINALEERGYSMLDAIVTSILSDPEFKNALLQE